jgi:hypothetical protein
LGSLSEKLKAVWYAAKDIQVQEWTPADLEAALTVSRCPGWRHGSTVLSFHGRSPHPSST